MTAAHGTAAATRADAARATMQTAAVNADPTATAADREQAAEQEMAVYESYRDAHGVPAYAQAGARHGLIRGHADRGPAEISAAEPEYGDLEPGQ